MFIDQAKGPFPDEILMSTKLSLNAQLNTGLVSDTFTIPFSFPNSQSHISVWATFSVIRGRNLNEQCNVRHSGRNP